MMYHRTLLTGGTSAALDGIDGSILSDGDACIVTAHGSTIIAGSTSVYFYSLNATSGATESIPNVIKPDINAGNKRWLVQMPYTGA